MSTAICASKVTKQYQLGGEVIKILAHADLMVSKGEHVAILGPSGSGKSTLLSLLAGLDQPTQGSIEVLGSSFANMSEAKLAQFRLNHIGIVFQQFHLMAHLNALENVAMTGMIRGQASAFAEAKQSLEAVGLGHRLKHLPHELSGGECQRVAIARALLGKPELILADEPSGSLDEKTGHEVMNLLFDLVKEHHSTLILVTHNKQLATHCHRYYHLSEGALRDETPK